MKTLTFTIVLLLALACKGQEKNVSNPTLLLSEVIDSFNIDTEKISLLIDKSDFRLYIYAEGRVLKEYPVVFGKNTVDDKLMQGDKCTPEGAFKMISKYPHNAWSKFIWINYPNDDSWRKHNTAKREGRIPAEAKIGGEVGIHGVPAGMDFLIDARVNWTLGCISLKNKDIDEVYPYVTNSTLIEIRK